MGGMFVSSLALLAYVTLVLGLTAKEVLEPDFLNGLDEKWWGLLGEEKNADIAIRPFEIEFTDEVRDLSIILLYLY